MSRAYDAVVFTEKLRPMPQIPSFVYISSYIVGLHGLSLAMALPATNGPY